MMNYQNMRTSFLRDMSDSPHMAGYKTDIDGELAKRSHSVNGDPKDHNLTHMELRHHMLCLRYPPGAIRTYLADLDRSGWSYPIGPIESIGAYRQPGGNWTYRVVYHWTYR